MAFSLLWEPQNVPRILQKIPGGNNNNNNNPWILPCQILYHLHLAAFSSIFCTFCQGFKSCTINTWPFRVKNLPRNFVHAQSLKQKKLMTWVEKKTLLHKEHQVIRDWYHPLFFPWTFDIWANRSEGRSLPPLSMRSWNFRSAAKSSSLSSSCAETLVSQCFEGKTPHEKRVLYRLSKQKNRIWIYTYRSPDVCFKSAHLPYTIGLSDHKKTNKYQSIQSLLLFKCFLLIPKGLHFTLGKLNKRIAPFTVAAWE